MAVAASLCGRGYMTIDSQALFLGSMTEVVLYVNPIKIAVVAILTVVWAVGVQWVDRDTNVVKTKREQWNLIVISGALVGYFVLFAVPFWQGSLFSLGLAFWVLIAGGTMPSRPPVPAGEGATLSGSPPRPPTRVEMVFR